MAEPMHIALVRPKIPTSGLEKPHETHGSWRSELAQLEADLIAWKREANTRERSLGKPSRRTEGDSQPYERDSVAAIMAWQAALEPAVAEELRELHRRIAEGDRRVLTLKSKLLRYDNPTPHLERAKVLREHQSARLEDWPEHGAMLREWVMAPAEDARSSCLLINGPVGTGKSRMAAAVLAEVLRYEERDVVVSTGSRALFVLARRLLTNLWRETSDGDGGSAMDGLARMRWLVIDDLGHEGRVSEAALGAFHELLSMRCGNYMRTVVTTNLSLEEIGKAYDPSIASRLAGWTQIVLTGPDRRRL